MAKSGRNDGMPNMRVSLEDIDGMVRFLTDLRDENGGYRASPEKGYLGISDCAVNDSSAATYALELMRTLGYEIPEPEASIKFFQERQCPEGYFKPLDPRYARYLVNDRFHPFFTWKNLRGLKVLGAEPLRDPRPFLASWIRNTPVDDIYPYAPDMIASCHVILDDEMPADCEEKLIEFCTRKTAPLTGWILQNNDAPFANNNPLIVRPCPFLCYFLRFLLKRDSGVIDLVTPFFEPRTSFNTSTIR